MKLQNIISLKNRQAIITGACGHVGRVICNTLAELGAELILIDHPKTNLSSVKRSLYKKWRIKCKIYPCNFEFENQRREVIKEIKASYKKINILVNNAAFVGTSNLPGWSTTFEKQTLETWRRALEVNLTAIFDLCQGFAPLLSNSQGGNILNITSIYAEIGPDWKLYKGTKVGNPAAYASSKGGLVTLTKWLATTLAPRVRVNAISPGGILRNQNPKFIRKYIQKTPMARMARETDLQGAVAFLTSDMALYITGQNLTIDGGYGLV